MGTYIVPNTYDDVILGADQNDRGLLGIRKGMSGKGRFSSMRSDSGARNACLGIIAHVCSN